MLAFGQDLGAQENCDKIFDKIPSQTEIAITALNGNLEPFDFFDPKTPDHFKAQIHEINAMVGSKIRIPATLDLNISPHSDNPNTYGNTRILFIGERFAVKRSRDGKMYFRPPNQSRPILAHEYGHVLFFENARSEVEVFRKYDELEAQIKAVEEEAKATLKQWETADQQKNAEGSKKYKELYVAVTGKLDSLRSDFQQLQHKYGEMKGKLGPYDEFFGDVISVLYTHDPKAIAKVLNIHGGVKSIEKQRRVLIDPRDPSRHIKRGPVPREIHLRLHEAQQYLWENYLKRPSLIARKAEVARGVLNAIFKEAEWLKTIPLSIEANTPDLIPMEYIEMENKRFIEALDRELGPLVAGDVQKAAPTF